MTEKAKKQPGGDNGRLDKLSDKHRTAARILLQTGSIAEAARQASVSYGTVSRWRGSKLFKQYYTKLRRQCWDEALALLQGNAHAVTGKLAMIAMMPLEDEYAKDDDGELLKTQDGKPILLRPGRPDLVLQAARTIIDTNFKWAADDVLARLEKLEKKIGTD